MGLSIILVGFACEKSSNAIDTVRFECGADFSKPLDSSRIVKLKGPSDKSLDSKSTTALGLTASGKEVELPISSRACVVVPDDVNSVRIKSSLDGQTIGAVSQNIGESKTAFAIVALDKLPTFTADFSCPGEGLFGRDTVQARLVTQVEGSAQSIGLQILARSVASKTVYPLLEKKFGFDLASFGETLDISTLVPGTYELELASADLSRGLRETYNLASLRKTCLLHKVDAMPVLGEVAGKSVIAKGKTILEADDAYKLNSCRMKLKDIADPSVCAPQAACLDPNSYISSSKVNAEDAGAFRYFFYQSDKALQRSNVACRDVVVSEAAPAVSIQWANPKYSIPGASLDRPLVHVPLKISVNHADVASDVLKQNLMCSAVFKIKEGLEIPATTLKCDSKECKGRDLGSPVPCGTDLVLNMRETYDTPELWDSVLKLRVVASDGVGNSSTSEAGIWLNSSHWKSVDIAKEIGLNIEGGRMANLNSLLAIHNKVYFNGPVSTIKENNVKGVLIEFTGSNYKIMGDKDVQEVPSEDEVNEFIARQVSDLTLRCDASGIFTENDELYFPFNELIRKHVGLNDLFPETCAYTAASHDTLYLRYSLSLTQFAYSNEVIARAAHLPSDFETYMESDLIINGFHHPIGLSRDGKSLYILRNYEWVKIPLPNYFEPSSHPEIRLGILNGTRIYMSDSREEWLSGDLTDLITENGSDVSPIEWTAHSASKCIHDSAMVNEDTDFQRSDFISSQCWLIRKASLTENGTSYEIYKTAQEGLDLASKKEILLPCIQKSKPTVIIMGEAIFFGGNMKNCRSYSFNVVSLEFDRIIEEGLYEWYGKADSKWARGLGRTMKYLE